MTQHEYLDNLKRALAGLPTSLISETLADYEHRFIEGLAFGRTASDIAAELPDPVKVAAGIRATTDFAAFQHTKTVPNAFRFVSSGIGLLFVNFLLVIPVLVFSALLVASFVTSFGMYVSGITVTATSLAGTDYVIGGPFNNVVIGAIDDSDRRDRMRARADTHRKIVVQSSDASNAGSIASSTKSASSKFNAIIEGDDNDAIQPKRALRGFGVMVGGILLFLLNLVIAKYAFIGMKRYINMNLSVLRTA